MEQIEEICCQNFFLSPGAWGIEDKFFCRKKNSKSRGLGQRWENFAQKNFLSPGAYTNVKKLVENFFLSAGACA